MDKTRAYTTANRKFIGEYVRYVYLFAGYAGVDPSIVIAQAVLETNWFTSYWWTTRGNPAGIGITGDVQQNQNSKIFSSLSAARAHLSHLQLYATGQINLPFLITDDPRYEAYVNAHGNVGIAPTIGGLTNTWSMDPNYATSIVRCGNEIFENEDQVKIASTGGLPCLSLD